MTQLRAISRAVWSWRRWAYAAYMAIALIRIPARTGFHFFGLVCDSRLTPANARLSLTKVPHVILFGVFFLATAAMFDRPNRRAIAWSLVATAALGVLVEVEEGATRTGNCRLTDVLPDIVGALIGALLLVMVTLVQRSVAHTQQR